MTEEQILTMIKTMIDENKMLREKLREFEARLNVWEINNE